MKLRAILTHDIGFAISWAIKELAGIGQIRYQHRIIELKNGDRFLICNRREHLLGYEFDEYICAPDYDDLRMVVETRLKKNGINENQNS